MMKEENNTVKLDTFRNIKDLKWCVKHTQLAVMVLVPGLCGLGSVCMFVCMCVCGACPFNYSPDANSNVGMKI